MRNQQPSERELSVLKSLATAGGDRKWVTAPTVASVGSTLGEDLNAATTYRILSRRRAEVEYRTTKGVRRFHLKQVGQRLLAPLESPLTPIFIRPGTPWSSQRQLQRFLKKHIQGFLFIIDPYISEETLDVLAEINVPMQILSSQLGRQGKEQKFLRAFKKFRREKDGCVELRQASSEQLHGRYIFTEGRGWIIDHSIQDLGKKPALIIPLHLDPIFCEVVAHFKGMFRESNTIVWIESSGIAA